MSVCFFLGCENSSTFYYKVNVMFSPRDFRGLHAGGFNIRHMDANLFINYKVSMKDIPSF